MGKNEKNDFAFFLVSTTEWTVDLDFENLHWVSRADESVRWAQADRGICRVLTILGRFWAGQPPVFANTGFERGEEK